MATVPAPPSKPPHVGAASSVNPRHNNNNAVAVALPSSPAAHTAQPGAASGIVVRPPPAKADYMILSSSHPPSGDAVYAAPANPSHSNSAVVSAPAALHDVDFLNSIAKELPQDSPVLSSVLYTHRSVVNADAGPDTQLQEVDTTVAHWRTEQLAKAAAQAELVNATSKQEALELHKDLVRREVEHNRAIKRMEDLISSLERRFETTLNSNPLGDAWERLGARHAQLNDEAQRLCSKLNNESEEHRRTQAALEAMTAVSKLIVTETVERSVVRADEASFRLNLVFLFRNEGVLRMLQLDCREERESTIAEESRLRARIAEHFEESKRHVERHEKTHAAFETLLGNTAATERGLRQNLEFEEQRSNCELVHEFEKATVVVDLVSKALGCAA